MEEKKRVTKAAGLMSTGTFISRITGFIRDIVLAKLFGASAATDAFFVAFRIPNLLREFLAEGSVSAGFVPVFTETLTREGRESAERLAGVVFAFLLSVVIAVCLLGILFAPYITAYVAPGFVGDADKFALTVQLTKIMFPFLLFISLAALTMGILNSLRSFFVPALAPAFFNLSIVVCAIFVAPRFAVPILFVGLGVTVGGAVQYGIQALTLSGKRFSLRPIFSFSHPGLRKILLLVLPAIAGMGVNQINVFLNNIFVSYLPEGSATYLYYGLRLVHFPIGIFGVAMAMAVLPSLSEQASKGDMDALRDTFSFSLRLLFFVTIPAMAGLIALAEPVVNILFQRGEFDRAAASGTITALLFYSTGLWAFVGVRIVVSTFYSLQDTKTPLKIALLSVATNIIFSLLLMGPLRHGGLALANAIASAVNFTVLFILLRARIARVEGRKIFGSVAKTLASSTVMGFAGWFAIRGEIWTQGGRTMEKAGSLAGIIFFCIAVYLAIMYVMKSEELRYLADMLAEKWGKRKGAG